MAALGFLTPPVEVSMKLWFEVCSWLLTVDVLIVFALDIFKKHHSPETIKRESIRVLCLFQFLHLCFLGLPSNKAEKRSALPASNLSIQRSVAAYKAGM